jgi:Leucine-rich repeat (LRR) protein
MLSGTQASDLSMQHLAQVKKLERLFMWDVTHISDKGTAYLRDLKNLEYIHLSGSQITDKSLAMFAELPKIKGLSLQFNRFTDKGLERVSHSHDLEALWVCGRDEKPNDITDAGLGSLQNMKNLKELGIQNSLVTSEGIEEFSKVMPACKVITHNIISSRQSH